MKLVGTHEGEDVYEAVLESDGAQVHLLSLGGIVRDWRVADRTGTARSVTLGFDAYEPYAQNRKAFGIIAGRIANRVREGRFTLDGKEYQLDRNMPPDHIHGGTRGLGRRVWAMESDGRTARLTLTSPDGEMGYPGAVTFIAEFRLEGHTLTFDFTGTPDRPTPIALAQHSYYDLGGPAQEHVLRVAGDRVTELGARKIPTGRILPVEGTRYDFRTGRPTGGEPIDINFCLTDPSQAATLTGSDFTLTLTTDRPGLQVYNGYDFDPMLTPGHGGRHYGPFPGIALEAQDFPDAMNCPEFPSIVHTPDAPYRQTTSVEVVPIQL